MSGPSDLTKYDDVLTSILVNEKSILGFLSAIFNFLARRTDFYYVPKGTYENMGFPPGVAEELVIKVLRKCDPKVWQDMDSAAKLFDVNNEIMCSTVAQEVEVVADRDSENEEEISANELELKTHSTNYNQSEIPGIESEAATQSTVTSTSKRVPDDYRPPEIPTQRNSDTYNGAERGNYSWSQNIMELDVSVKLPPDIKSSKELNVIINPGDICVARRNGDVIVKDTLPYKIKISDSFWSISEGRLLLHLEKVQERWWNKLLISEESVDLSKIDCSRPLDELPEDHVAKHYPTATIMIPFPVTSAARHTRCELYGVLVARESHLKLFAMPFGRQTFQENTYNKVRELQWNQERKMKGLPTSDEIRNMDVLKRAWNAPGSPFQGQEFDPSILNNSPSTFSSLSARK